MAVNLSITLLYFFIYISYSYLQIQYIDTINVSFCSLQQLLRLTATNLNAKMTSTFKILPHPDKYPFILGSQTRVNLDILIEIMKGIQVRWPRRPWNRASPSNTATRKFTCVWDPSTNGHGISYQNCSCLWYYSKHIRDICKGAAKSCTSMSFLHWDWWPSIWATVVRCKMVS